MKRRDIFKYFTASGIGAAIGAIVGSKASQPHPYGLMRKTASGKSGAENLGFYDPVAPAYLKTISDIVNGLPINVLRNIPKVQHASIKGFTSTVDQSARLAELINDSDIKKLDFNYGQFAIESPLPVVAGKAIEGVGRGGSRIYFDTTSAFEQLNGALPSDNLMSSIKGLYLLGGGAATIGVNLGRTWGLSLHDMRIRNCETAIKDYAGVQNAYDLIDIEGRFIITGTRGTDLATDNRVTRLKQVWTAGDDAGILLQNCVNTVLQVVHQNAPVDSGDPLYSAARVGLQLADQCEGVFISHLQSVGMGYGFIVNTIDAGNPPLACKLHHSIIDQYITAGGLVSACSGFQELDNTYSYQLSDAANGVTTVIGADSLRYKQTANTYLETQLEAVLIQNGSDLTRIAGYTGENVGKKTPNSYADIRVEPNTTSFTIDGVDASGTNHSQAVLVESGSSNNYRIAGINCQGNSIAKVSDGGSGLQKHVESGAPQHATVAELLDQGSEINRDALGGHIVRVVDNGRFVMKENTGAGQVWNYSDGTTAYIPVVP